MYTQHSQDDHKLISPRFKRIKRSPSMMSGPILIATAADSYAIPTYTSTLFARCAWLRNVSMSISKYWWAEVRHIRLVAKRLLTCLIHLLLFSLMMVVWAQVDGMSSIALEADDDGYAVAAVTSAALVIIAPSSIDYFIENVSPLNSEVTPVTTH
uniref:Uncharacterized protein n=1 Tax=Glossina palpalis gambiensis TaxID=67801 RepID=A0A1B0BXI7_9MUSC